MNIMDRKKNVKMESNFANPSSADINNGDDLAYFNTLKYVANTNFNVSVC